MNAFQSNGLNRAFRNAFGAGFDSRADEKSTLPVAAEIAKTVPQANTFQTESKQTRFVAPPSRTELNAEPEESTLSLDQGNSQTAADTPRVSKLAIPETVSAQLSVQDRLLLETELRKQAYFKKKEEREAEDAKVAKKTLGANKTNLYMLVRSLAGHLSVSTDDIWTDFDVARAKGTVESAMLVSLGNVEDNLDQAWEQYVQPVYASLIRDTLAWMQASVTGRSCALSQILKASKEAQTRFSQACRAIKTAKELKQTSQWNRIRVFEENEKTLKSLAVLLKQDFSA
jgi:hypothetical protein